jgi:hypothetical protein
VIGYRLFHRLEQGSIHTLVHFVNRIAACLAGGVLWLKKPIPYQFKNAGAVLGNFFSPVESCGCIKFTNVEL